MSLFRSVLDSCLSWLDGAPLRSELLAWSLLAAGVGLAVWGGRDGEAAGGRRGRALFVFVLVACLAAFRWPALFVPETFNIDESQMVSGAVTLRHDPVFWRSIEGQTIGPLDYYALVLPTWWGGRNVFLGARTLGLLLVGAVIVLTYRTARRTLPERVARVAVLPLLAFFAFTRDGEFLHYSSEQLPIALLALAIAALVRGEAGGGRRWSLLAGIALGLAPLAKMQVAPLVAALLAGAAGWRWWQRAAPARAGLDLRWLLAGFGAVWLALAAYATAFHVWPDMLASYFRANLFYVDANTEQVARWRVWRAIAAATLRHAEFAPLLLTTLALVGAAAIGGARPRGRIAWLAVLGGLASVGALAGVLAGARTFAHYLLLLTPGLGLLLASGFGALLAAESSRARAWRLAGWVLLLGGGLVLPAANRLVQGNPFAGLYRENRANAAGVPNPVVTELRRWVAPGEPLAVWGWEPLMYLRTGCWQATRDPSTRRQVEAGADRAYYRARYLDDLRRSNPRALVDTTGAHRRGFGFENFPEFGAYLERHYVLVAEIEQRRIYVRRDVVARGAAASRSEGGR